MLIDEYRLEVQAVKPGIDEALVKFMEDIANNCQ